MPSAPSRIRRLGSLTKTSASSQRSKTTPAPTVRKHTCCDDPKVEDDGEGHLVCQSCFTQISESNIVADVTFEENSRGAATVQGGFVGENARHARTLGSAAYRRVGVSDRNSQQEIEANGRRALAALCPKLGVLETVSNQALQLYGLAAQHNFSAGRRNDEVIAACLYAACRRQKDNAILLMDIAELQRINVFRLGEVYKTLCQELYLDQSNVSGVGKQYFVEVESLIMKYCRRLEFGDATRQVAEDAVKIIRRMKRDWIVTGRHPAGLCGACIILAARMNNFKRSVREVVYVAKVADMTVAKRIEEFRRTRSAAMTVEQFRKYGIHYKPSHEPPVLYESQLKQDKLEAKKRKRQEENAARDVIEISENGSNASSRESSVATATLGPQGEVEENRPNKRRRTSTVQQETPAPTQQEPRRDAEGFVIPPLPADLANGTQGSQQAGKRKPGRPKKKAPPPIIISKQELAVEESLEFDINNALEDHEVILHGNELEQAKNEERAKALAEQQKKREAEKTETRRAEEGLTWWDRSVLNDTEEVTDEALEAEFANDPEVANCILSLEEQKIKEQIWVEHNEDWLRIQQEKALLQMIAQSTNRNEQGKKKNKPGKRKKKGKMGDGTTLAKATTPILHPADANVAMLEQRSQQPFSKYIDYEVLRKVYQPSSSSASRVGSEAPSVSGSNRDRSTDGRESSSSSPAPQAQAVRLETPPATREVDAASPSNSNAPRLQDMEEGGDGESEGEGYASDYYQDELDYGYGTPPPYEDDREDVGDDWGHATNPTSRVSLREDVFGDDDDW